MKKIFVFLSLILAYSSALVPKIKLDTGHSMPVVGIVTHQIKTEDIAEAMNNTIKSGCFIDSAAGYLNEKEVGKFLKSWFQNGGKREDIFVGSKLPGWAFGPGRVQNYVEKSLKDLNLDYLDLYTIHIPMGHKEGKHHRHLRGNGVEFFEDSNHVEIWKILEGYVKRGLIRAIGLTQFNKTQIMNVVKHAEIMPSIIQGESHLYMVNEELLNYAGELRVPFLSHVPVDTLRSPNNKKALHPIDNLPLIQELSQKYRKSPVQLLMKYNLQRGMLVTAETSKPNNLIKELDIWDFNISSFDMKRLKSIDLGERGRIAYHLELNNEFYKHPQFPFPMSGWIGIR